MHDATGTPRSAIRLLHVVLSLDPGGTERLVIELARHTAERFPTAVCCLDQRGKWAGELDAAGVPVVALDRRPGFHPVLGAKLRAVADEFGATVLHCHQYSPYVYGQVARLYGGRQRLIYTEHGRASEAPPTIKRRTVNRLLGRMPGLMFAVSQELRDYMVRSGFPAPRVGTIYNGVVPGPRSDTRGREEARRRLGLPGGEFVVGTVARLDPVKDLGTLLSAFTVVAGLDQPARLVIVGDGPEREALQARADALGARVVFTGARDDVRVVLPAFDAFVNCSVSEGVSVTILEAMAAGVPVVATAVGGTPEVVEDGTSGLLVPARSPGELAAALHRLARHADLRRRLGEGGRARLEAAFSFDRMLAEYLDAYRTGGA